MSETGKVLFIGVGRMGNPMARRLLAAGLSLAVCDLSEQALEPFRRQGLSVARFPAELAGEAVITMLPTDAEVREAVLGERGALSGPHRRAVLIDMSSSAPGPTRQLGQELARAGVAMLDAPVSGGVSRAQTGELTTMVGGSGEVFERWRPLLAHMCATIRQVGALGAGDAMKALNNYLSAAAFWASCEALVIGARAGLDPAVMVDVWKTGTARSHALEVKIPRAVLPRTFDYGFSLGLMAKDLGIAARLARSCDVPAPLLAATEGHLLHARDALGPQADLTSLITLIERWAGFELPAGACASDKEEK
jgi:3-hydroxyisobutyrate dehydrogenase